MKKNPAVKKSTPNYPKFKCAYGGVLRKTREGRNGPRSLTTHHTMHLVLRSTKATGEWSFFKPKNKSRIRQIILKHAQRNHVHLESIANVGNHLHLHLKLKRNHNYHSFIRAVTGAIALAVMGLQYLKSRSQKNVKNHGDRFWDYRPFTIFVNTYRHFLNMRDYMKINQLEGIGFSRLSARFLLAYEYDRKYTVPDF
jgi:REP element-mobilizing transposase RayT